MGEIGIVGTEGYSYNLCSGSHYSKLTTLLVNFLLKFQMLISQICQYFFSKKFAVQKLLIFSTEYFSVFGYQNISVYLVIRS